MSGASVQTTLDTIAFAEALAILAEEVSSREARTISKLPLGTIRTAISIFQPRDVEHAFLASDQHIKTLAEAIQDAPGHALEPLTVWWSGKHWYVIDGHHRLQAYRSVAKKVELPAIPVKTFEGTLNEAIRESAALNCRDKLPMSKDDKCERAWKLVCLPERWTKASIHLATGASERTVGNMRKAKADLLKNDPEVVPLSMTWAEVKRGQSDGEKDETWEEKLAIDWQKKLVKAFGTKLADQPEVAARAFQLYSKRLPRQLIESWALEAMTFAEEKKRLDEDADF